MSKLFHRLKKNRADRASNVPTTRVESSDGAFASASKPKREESATKAPAGSQRPRPAEKSGLFELAKGKHDVETTIDVVAVHGLQGDLYQTWTHENGTMWLESILPDHIPYARIMTFGYNSRIAFSSSAAQLEDKSIELINRLSMKRSSVENGSTRPIVFVCHSLGGILVKKALILAHEHSSDENYRNIVDNTKGIAFLGVPHRGSDAAWWFSFAASSLKGATLGMSTHTVLVKDLQKASPALATISKQFVERGRSLQIYTFYETRKLSGIVVVDKQSAVLNLPNEKLFPVDANHRTICHIPSAESQEFEAMGAWIEDLVRSVANNTSPNSTQLESYFEVPNRRVSHFFGRKDVMSKIDQAILLGPGPYLAVLRGIGGQGKSQVAMEYCYRKKDAPFTDVFWIDATSESSVTSTFISISGLIGTANDQMLDNNARVAFVSRKFARWPTRLLLVFDNYDSPHEFPNIRDFFPSNNLSSILVTGRHADIATLVLGQESNLIELSGLEDTAAVELLEHHSQVKETDTKFGEQIVTRLGYHPLAITQAGTYIRKGGIPLSEFMDVYKQEKEEILRNTPQLTQYRRKLGDAENETSLNVFTTWQLSFQQLLQNTPEDSAAVKLLRLLAFFDNKDISEWIFFEFYRNKGTNKTSELLEWFDQFTDSQQCWNNRLFKKNLLLLHDSCLLQSVAQDSDGYSHTSLHPLVKDWIQLQMGKSACQQYTPMAAEILGDILCSFRDSSNYFKLPLHTKQYLALHIIAQEDNNSEHVGIDGEELPQDLVLDYKTNQSMFASFFKELGLFEKAELLGVQAMETRKKLLGAEHPETLTTMLNLAGTYWSQSRWEEAETLEVQVMETRKRVLGAEHPETLISMLNLAGTYWSQSRWEKAEMLEAQVMETRKRVLGAEHPETLQSMNNLAVTYKSQGRYKEAETLHLQALEMKNRVLGAEHPDTLLSMHNLAVAFGEQGRYTEASKLMEEYVQLGTRIFGQDHPNILSSASTLLELKARNLETGGVVEESPTEEGRKEE
ncbi:hypothetical protein L207DRAFT_485775 [Hyaloscypha variabilis F]|uniref:NB-ARC domain-containing protein n=1 Tax=Hyaloscypha variabilis (strain UAMH 11265 / GT02V1 / F) TaxID=1149755 RepID=A0A2J6RUU5_HYAVF|nr:hypothetical protein L207DRAFT_485775 [Hyaloscypha variabilis F]